MISVLNVLSSTPYLSSLTYSCAAGVFMLVVMTFNCVSLIMATIVMNIKKLGDDSPCPDVPRWLFALCHHVLGRVVCTPYLWAAGDSRSISPAAACNSKPTKVPHQSEVDLGAPLDNVTGEQSGRKEVHETQRCLPNQRDYPGNAQLEEQKVRSNNDGMRRFVGPNDDEETLGKTETAPHERTEGTEKCLGMRRRRQSRNVSEQSSATAAGAGAGSASTFWPLYDHSEQQASQDMSRNDRVAAGFLMKRRWFYVAEVVDKFLFVVYLVLLTCSIFTVLYLIPVYFRNDS